MQYGENVIILILVQNQKLSLTILAMIGNMIQTNTTDDQFFRSASILHFPLFFLTFQSSQADDHPHFSIKLINYSEVFQITAKTEEKIIARWAQQVACKYTKTCTFSDDKYSLNCWQHRLDPGRTDCIAIRRPPPQHPPPPPPVPDFHSRYAKLCSLPFALQCPLQIRNHTLATPTANPHHSVQTPARCV